MPRLPTFAALAPFAALLVSSPASAVGPPSHGTGPASFGSQDLARARTAGADVPRSARAAWDAFLLAHPGPWRAEWDTLTGTPRQLWGGTIPLAAPGTSGKAVEASIRELLAGELAPFVGVPVARLRLEIREKRGDTWYLRFARVTRDGTPVAGAFVEARVTRGRLVLLRVETHPAAEATVLPARRFSREAAIRLASEPLRRHGALVPESDATAVLVPVRMGARMAYRPAWEVVRRSTRGEAWRTRVDAADGALLSRVLLTPHVTGRVTALVEPRTVGDPLVEFPVAFAAVADTNGGMAVTATDGTWTLGAAGPIAVGPALSGPYARVLHDVTDEAFARYDASDGAADHLWTDSAEATQAEIAAYLHLQTVRAWVARVTPDLAWLEQQVTAVVGIPDSCNAFWDGTVRLFGEGPTCNDTARIADVVYHEYGHGFHQNARAGGVLDPTVGEGIGDYIAATINDSPRIGAGLLKNTPDDGALRDIEEDAVYPDDLQGDVHLDGRIFAGAMWDLRKLLGAAATDAIFAGIVEAGPTLEQTFVEALLSDDDDGDLSNGTPNVCAIESAFGAHGLAGASGYLSLVHQEVSGPVPADEPIPIAAVRPTAAGACASGGVQSAVLRWLAADGGPSGTVTMALSGDTFTASIPPVEAGHTIRYWIEGMLPSGLPVTSPERAPASTFAFHTGPLETVWRVDFEDAASAAEWGHGGTGDDWQVGAPGGFGGDPDAAFSGTSALGNRLDGDGLYEAGADTWIESPPIDCRRCRGARLQLRRWASVQQGASDAIRIFVNGVPVWQNDVGQAFDDVIPQDSLWSFEDYDISELADGESEVRIRFALRSDGFLEHGGWNLDDIAIVMPPRGGGGGGHGCGCSLGADASHPAGAFMGLFAAAAAFLARRRRARV